MRRTICLILSLVLILSAAICVPVAAAEKPSTDNITGATVGDIIYFDANGWKSFNRIYCHIWVMGGDSFYGWQTPYEECQKVSGTKYSYDLTKLTGSIDISGGMKEGGKYGVIFSANTGIQSYDCTIGRECIGDTAKLTGNQIENPVDSNKRGDEVVWTNNSGKYGPHLALTSIGNVVGSKLAPGETGIQVIGDWIPTYVHSPNVNAVNALAKAYPKFGIKTVSDLTNVYAYVVTKDGVDKKDLPDIKATLEKAFRKAYPNSDIGKTDISKWKVKGIKNKTYTGKKITQKISVVKGSKKATVKVTYSNNKNAGTAKMTIKGKGDYKGTIKKTFKIKKAANTVKVSTSIKTVDHNVLSYLDCNVKPISIKKAKGKISCKKVSGSSALTVKSNGAVVVKKWTSTGLYTAKIKVTAKGNRNYKSKSKTVTAKIVVY